MNILLLYFTGTYNTLYLTTLIKNNLLSKGYNVETLILSDKAKINVNKYDYIGIGYPIHAFNAPKIVVDKIKELDIKNKKYFIYKNGAQPNKLNEASSLSIIRNMNKNKNVLLGEYMFVMPSNFSKKTENLMVRYEFEYVYKYVKFMCDNLVNIKKYKPSLSSKIVSFFCKSSFSGFKANSSSYSVDKEKCIKCRKCITSCPTKNIEYSKEEKKIIFKNNCVTCMRCSFSCPVNAINIGMLEKSKVNGRYDFLAINSLENTFDLKTLSKKEYKIFKKYFDYIDSLTK